MRRVIGRFPTEYRNIPLLQPRNHGIIEPCHRIVDWPWPKRGSPRPTPSFAANHIRVGAIETKPSLSFFRHIEVSLTKTGSSVSRKRGAAIGGTRRTGSAADQVHTTVVTTCCDEGSVPAWLLPEGDITRGLRPHMRKGQPEAHRGLISGHFGATLPGSRPRWP